MLNLNENIFNEVDYTVFDGTGTELDGGVYSEENVSYKDLFEFVGFDKFNNHAKIWKGDTAREYVNNVM